MCACVLCVHETYSHLKIFLNEFLTLNVNVKNDACIKGNQKGNIKCYARERANTKQPF